MNKKYTYILKGLDCANCAIKIENTLSKNSNYQGVSVNFNTSKLIFETEINEPLKEITKIVTGVEPNVKINDEQISNEFKLDRFNLYRLLIGLVLGISIVVFPFNKVISTVIIILSYCILLPRTLIKAIKILIRSKSLDENMLITISVIGAFLIGDAFEGFMVIGLYEIGKLLEEMAINKSKRSVKELMDIKPEYANLKLGKEILVKSPDDIKIGDIIVVKVGEKVPLDGIITSGKTDVDIKALTGESVPAFLEEGSLILSGSINLSNIIEVKVTNTYQNSTVSKILELVENATNRKAKTENFVSKMAKVYTPIIMALSLLTGILFPIITDLSISESIYRALSFLVISCPCAIAISVPLSYFAGIGKSSKEGILVKGSDYLDMLRKVTTIVFDKTGTLTTGSFKVMKIIPLSTYKEKELIKICAYGEKYSNHPIAKSIVEYYGKAIEEGIITNYKEIPGTGINYKYQDKKVKITNQTTEEEKEQGTVLYISIDDELVGKIIIGDEIKKGAKEVISKLHSMGIRTMLFTGDNKKVADSVGKHLGIDNIESELLPNDKYERLEIILKKSTGKVAFVGDGINDAPVLTLADIGISMGSVGSSSAIEASDVVLMTDELNKINEAINISKRTTRIIKQNLIVAIGTKLLFIILNLFGYSTMALAVFADVGVTVLTILNSIRILKD